MTTAGQFDEFFVDGTIDVDDAKFVGSNNHIIVRNGGTMNLKNSELAGDEVSYQSGSRGTVESNDFGNFYFRLGSKDVFDFGQ